MEHRWVKLYSAAESERHEYFAQEIRRGLGAEPKSISSEFFYDDEGSRLFAQIMQQPEYYLTGLEDSILADSGPQIAQKALGFWAKKSFDGGKGVQIVDLGSGNGKKSAHLLQAFVDEGVETEFVPVDISAGALQALSNDSVYSSRKLRLVHATYAQAFSWLQDNPHPRRIILFLGSNLGNFDDQQALTFVSELRRSGSVCLVGFDLVKDLRRMTEAYNDKAGVTRAFNLNLLARINRELGGNFVLDDFWHHGFFNPRTHAMESYLLSRTDQNVRVEELGLSLKLEAWEPIFLERSRKYRPSQIDDWCRASGFESIAYFSDPEDGFRNVLWGVDA